MDTLIITGWGWKEYAVAAAVALKALKGRADIMGMSKRRLPEFMEGEGLKWKSIVLVGMICFCDSSLKTPPILPFATLPP